VAYEIAVRGPLEFTWHMVITPEVEYFHELYVREQTSYFSFNFLIGDLGGNSKSNSLRYANYFDVVNVITDQ